MIVRFCRCLVAVCATVLFPVLANAYTMIIVKNGSPIRIDQAHAYERGNQYFECVSFTNMSEKAVARIRFHFVYIDAKGERVGEDTFDRTGSFDPGGSVANIPITLGVRMPADYQDLNRYPNCQSYRFPSQGIAINLVAVERVDFADGTSWVMTPASASPSPNPSPTAMPSGASPN